jgi:hypothetical protein
MPENALQHGAGRAFPWVRILQKSYKADAHKTRKEVL